MEVGSVSNSPTQDFEFSAEEQKRIIRMIDLRVVLPTGILYCVSIMDRANLGVANIAGLSKDLNLIDNRYVRVVHEHQRQGLLTMENRPSHRLSSLFPTRSSSHPRLFSFAPLARGDT